MVPRATVLNGFCETSYSTSPSASLRLASTSKLSYLHNPVNAFGAASHHPKYLCHSNYAAGTSTI